MKLDSDPLTQNGTFPSLFEALKVGDEFAKFQINHHTMVIPNPNSK